MEYMSHLQKKRRHEGDIENWNDCQSKRQCSGLGGGFKLECGAVNDSPMDTWDTQERGLPNRIDINTHSTSRMQEYSVPIRGPALPCPRCMAGESGHINHIMGY